MSLYLCLSLLLLGVVSTQAQGSLVDQSTPAWDSIALYQQRGRFQDALYLSEALYQHMDPQSSSLDSIAAELQTYLIIEQNRALLDNDGIVQAIQRIEQTLQQSTGIRRAVLQSFLAECYQTYYNDHRYQIHKRSNTADVGTDFRTWNADQLVLKSRSLYHQSLQPAAELLNAPIEEFRFLVLLNSIGIVYRPTLYDVLLQRALTYWTNPRLAQLKQEPTTLDWRDSNFFAPASDFAAYSLPTKDTLSRTYQILQLYQQGLTWRSENAIAFIELDLRRLDFVHEQSTSPHKDAFYERALQRLLIQSGNHAVYGLVAHRLAQLYQKQGNQYHPFEQVTPRWKLKAAYDLCHRVVQDHPQSYGAQLCQDLLNELTYQVLDVHIERTQCIDQPLLFSLAYRNVSQIYCRILPYHQALRDSLNHRETVLARNAYLLKQPALKTWQVTLPSTQDLQEHRTELDAPALGKGQYLLVAYTKDTPTVLVNVAFQVSNLRALGQEIDEKQLFWIVNASTGSPITGAQVQFEATNENEESSNESKHFFATSNAKGKVVVPQAILRHKDYYTATITYGTDTLLLQDHFTTPTDDYWDQEPLLSTHFFLDRSIYRPGQTVYFKGLVLNPKHKVPQPVPFKKRDLILTDAYGKTIWEKKLTTNAYGSFQDSIVLPLGVALGNLELEDASEDSWSYSFLHNKKNFRVEEYRRPKFHIKNLPLDRSYLLGDSVNVSGIATAYAGSAIAQATVKYTIRRKAVDQKSWYYQNVNNASIQQTGTTQTNAQGRYDIPFFAAPNASKAKDTQKFYWYYIKVTVTDITGETQEYEHKVSIGPSKLKLHFELPNYILQKELENLPITLTPYNGSFTPTQGIIIIQRIQQPKQIYHPKPWERADVFALDTAKFKTLFPNRPYQQENQDTTWKVLETVINQPFTADHPQQLLTLDRLPVLDAGYYRIVIQVDDPSGTPVQHAQYTHLATATKSNTTQVLASYLERPVAVQPGQCFKLHLGSGLKKATVLYELENLRGFQTQRWVSFQGQKTLIIPITEALRGGGQVKVTLIVDGQYYQKKHYLPVPWTNQYLDLSFKSFRSTLIPGQTETWTIQIKDKKGNPTQAEVLANLYDASLDALIPHKWFNAFLPVYNSLSKPLFTGLFNPVNDRVDHDNQYSWTFHHFFPSDRWQLLLPQQLYGDILNNKQEKVQLLGGVMDSSITYHTRIIFLDGASIQCVRAIPMLTPRSHQADIGYINHNTSRKHIPAQAATSENGTTIFDVVPLRKNLKETVFFKPNLRTDVKGNVSIEFTMNEALSEWKLMLFAHSKRFQFGCTERYVFTQKELMVTPNPPRFFREDDHFEFTAKVNNLTETPMNGEAQLQLLDALTMKPVNDQFGLTQETVAFSAAANGTARLTWTIQVPQNWTRPIVHRVVAQAGNYSDGEEALIPVLSNRLLVTETKPLPVRGQQTKTFECTRLKTADQSPTLKHHRLTLEFNQNPAWSAVQSLPYLMEYPYECTEQISSRYYANALASHIANSQPQIKAIFERWHDLEPTIQQSPLLNNQELKYALLSESPWILDAAQQQKKLGLLFDLHHMSEQLNKAQQELLNRQDYSSGGFSWMPDGPENPYITQHLVAIFGHLNALGITATNERLKMALKKAVHYLDVQATLRHQQQLQQASQQQDSAQWMQEQHLTSLDVHYLYARSFFLAVAVKDAHQAAFNHCQQQAQAHWHKQPLYLQALLGLSLHRLGDTLVPLQIVESAHQQALQDDELGMYWKLPKGYFWHQLPIETHCAMIELFDEVAKDEKVVEALKIWLLKQRQTTHWKTTKATVAASYALLMTGDNWLLEDKDVSIQLGKQVIDVANIPKEAGTGYFKTTWEGDAIQPEMATIKVTNPNKNVAWGALYWQYFEQMDKITHFKETPLKIDKQLFKEVPGDRGPVLKPISKEELTPGDKIVVRIELRVDRPMEYVHMKDHRASGFEPINVLSQYKWQDGLGYYESTRDAATNFFFGYLPKGTYVFEYPLRVNLKGDFSNGITTIQCMYAPEFTAHSEGIRVTVE